MKYPEDFINRVIQDDCLKVIDKLPDVVLDGVLIDPPYGEGMGYEGDETLGQASGLLSCFLRSIEPKIKSNGHLVIFWTMRNLDTCLAPIGGIIFDGFAGSGACKNAGRNFIAVEISAEYCDVARKRI